MYAVKKVFKITFLDPLEPLQVELGRLSQSLMVLTLPIPAVFFLCSIVYPGHVLRFLERNDHNIELFL